MKHDMKDKNIMDTGMYTDSFASSNCSDVATLDQQKHPSVHYDQQVVEPCIRNC